MSKKKLKKTPAPAAVKITQQKRDRVASILAIVLGLISMREGGAVLLGVTTPDYPVLPWLVWYNVVLGAVSVVAGAGIWTKRDWSGVLALNILTFHGIVFAGLFALYKSGQIVAMRSIFAMMFRTFAWIVIYSLIKWRRQKES
jgi:hypothetical protein